MRIKKIDTDKEAVILSALKGEKSKVDTVRITNNGNHINSLNVYIEGSEADYFKILSTTGKELDVNDVLQIPIEFQPDIEFVGMANAQLVAEISEGPLLKIPLRGLSTKGLEGKNEASLSWVVQTLGYPIELGWDSLANHVRADLQGEELPQSLFEKSGKNELEMIPVARYSPNFPLPFGYYTIKDSLPVLHQVGVLADSKSYPEHQTLFPKLISGGTTFDPHSEPFGFYTTSPSHDAYSQDLWNSKLFKKNAAHACRIYPVKNLKGEREPNQFLVCFEEAFNGDYQDYVFLVKNIQIFKEMAK
ncbi:unnamed protein product [Ectocarpus sp. 12 AP-2014]